MFFSTFYGCSGLEGSIPSDLLSGKSGAPATSMFYGTFNGCSGITGGHLVLPASITFTDANIVGPLSRMMRGMTNWEGELFWGDDVIHTALTPDSRIFTFLDSTKIPDYDTIHANWK
jgi:hypothetical protein